MTLDDVYAMFQVSGDRDPRVVEAIMGHDLDDTDRAWLRDALASDEPHAYFASSLLHRKGAVDESFFAPIIGAIVAGDPIWNRYLVEPLVERFGARRVLEALVVAYDAAPDDERRLSARTAAYWAKPGRVYLGVAAFERREATPESQAAYDAVADLVERFGFDGGSEIHLAGGESIFDKDA
jgi:hypothetical protein